MTGEINRIICYAWHCWLQFSLFNVKWQVFLNTLKDLVCKGSLSKVGRFSLHYNQNSGKYSLYNNNVWNNEMYYQFQFGSFLHHSHVLYIVQSRKKNYNNAFGLKIGLFPSWEVSVNILDFPSHLHWDSLHWLYSTDVGTRLILQPLCQHRK